MAERRMIARAIVRSDAFCSMSPEAQLTYYHMIGDADDDGVVGSLRVAMADAKAGPEHLAELIIEKFVLPIGRVYAIKHWWNMNTFRRDRYHESTYQEELALLIKKPDGSYTYRDEKTAAENLGKTLERLGKTPAPQVGATMGATFGALFENNLMK